MHIFILIIIIIFLYGAFSTSFHSTEMVGKIGKAYGEGNIKLFGYLAYVDLLIITYPLYQIYKNKNLINDIEFYTGWILFMISLVLFQSLVVDIYNTGTIGLSLYDFLNPFVGKAGMWLLWFLITTISLVLILDEIPDFKAYLNTFNKYRKLSMAKIMVLWEKIGLEIENPFFDKKSTDSMTTIVASRTVRKNLNFDSLKQKTPRKLAHRKKTLKKKIKQSNMEAMMLEDRSLEDIGNIQIQEIPSLHDKSNVSVSVKVEGKDKENIKKNTKEKVKLKPKEKSKEKVPSKPQEEEPEKYTEESIVEERESTAKIIDELKENRALMDQIEKGEIESPDDFILPYLDFLEEAPQTKTKVDEEEIDRKVHELLEKLGQFKITGEVMDIYSGPLVTTFEFKPAANVKVSKILNLQDDLAMALCAETIRIQAPIPGRDVVGIEIPNEKSDTIYLRDILESKLFTTSKSPLTMAMGKDIVGNPFVTDLKKLPHLLIAGTTGSGKSVGINAMILSLLYRNDPDSLKLMLIDPKMLEFSIYNDIPHLLTPVITDAVKAIAALANMVGEMERRYKMMAENRTKNIDNYNEKAGKKGLDTLPFIVIVIDELADLMMNGGKDVEFSIARLAQMARAAGIHLIVATQRPSVDVVTGLIKANLPSRLSYRVGQRIDSKVILDALGADSLLGKGDALFTPPGSNTLVRIHAPWNSEDEIEEIVEFLKAQRTPDYDERYLVKEDQENKVGLGIQGDLDALYEDAKQIIITDQKTSISYLQRKLQIGYNRSANIIEQLQEMGVLSTPNNKGQREIIL
ncbi:MAG: Cell division protein FtsK [uncultured Sulfurovum sp.]|uniref:Cell division protein FtsK n=1 Tax=uncultured Sulfurovum sp. TaxID=269237 RepID=A0A6S6TFG8_9BACT|nr:MAG: Cell division protein FtsK [uncultured Sulfurovum sp.]